MDGGGHTKHFNKSKNLEETRFRTIRNHQETQSTYCHKNTERNRNCGQKNMGQDHGKNRAMERNEGKTDAGENKKFSALSRDDLNAKHKLGKNKTK